MDIDGRNTGTKAEYRNLVRVLHTALQEADTCAGYATSAEAVGNERLAGFFREVQDTYVRLAEQAEEVLGVEDIGLELDGIRSSSTCAQGDPDPGDVSPGQSANSSAEIPPDSPSCSAP